MRKTRAWKHNRKDRHQWGTTKADKRNTPFMVLDVKYLVDDEEE